MKLPKSLSCLQWRIFQTTGFILFLIVGEITLAQDPRSPDPETLFRWTQSQKMSKDNTALDVLGWVPTGGPTFNMSPNCMIRKVVNAYELKLKESSREAGKYLQNRYAECASEWKKSDQTYWSILRGYRVEYPYLANPNIRSVKFNLPGNRRVDGILALQAGSGARPLVVYQCGLQCDVASASFRKALMHLYDEGPFHVLILGSVTSGDFQRTNGLISAGGYDEGRQIFWLAEQIKGGHYSWSPRVNEIHLSGFSLGGHSALFAALYSESNLRNGAPLIQSTFLACAPVRLRHATENIYGSNLVSQALYRAFLRQTELLYPYLPLLQDIFTDPKDIRKIKKTEAANYVAKFSLPGYALFTRDPELTLAPFQGELVDDVESFWRVNDLIQDDMVHKLSQMKQSVFFLASKDDPVVLSRDHYVPLMQIAENSNMKNVGGTITDFGGHCDFDLTNDWQLASGVLRSFFVSNSPSLQALRKTQIVPFVLASGKLEALKLRPNEELHSYEWQLKEGSPHADMEFRFRSDSWWRVSRKVHVELPLAGFGANVPVKVPQEEWRRHQLLRWMNSELQILSQDHSFFNAETLPRWIQWSSYPPFH